MNDMTNMDSPNYKEIMFKLHAYEGATIQHIKAWLTLHAQYDSHQT